MPELPDVSIDSLDGWRALRAKIMTKLLTMEITPDHSVDGESYSSGSLWKDLMGQIAAIDAEIAKYDLVYIPHYKGL